MKHLGILFMLIVPSVKGQTWNWAVGENANGEGWSVCHDNAGDIYLTGSMSGTGSIGGQTYSVSGNRSVLIKYNPLGGVIWQQSITNGNGGYGVECDNSGNVFLCSIFTNTATVGNQSVVSKSGFDPLLTKFDNNGNLLWVANPQQSSGNIDMAKSVSTDTGGNCIMVGAFSGTVLTFGSNTLTSGTPTNNATFYIVKYDPNGAPLWAQSAVGGTSFAEHVDTDKYNNIYVTGYFGGTTTIGTQTLISNGLYDSFVIKYDPNGNVIWIKQVGGAQQDLGQCVYIDPNGDVFASGAFSSSTFTAGSIVLTNNGQYDAYLLKFDSSGSLIWADGFGGISNEQAFSIANFNGNIWVAGSVASNSIKIGNTTLTISVASDAMFLAECDGTGQFLSASKVEGGGDDKMEITALNCNLYVGGDVVNNNNQPVFFGTHSITPYGNESLFIANLQIAPTPTVSITGPTSLCAGGNLTLTANGASTYSWSGYTSSPTLILTPTATSVYTLLAKGSASCLPTQTVVTTVSIMPTPTLSATTPAFCKGDKRIISVSGADTYKWYNGTKTNSILVQPTVSTTYSVIGTNTLGVCTNTMAVSVSVTVCNEILEQVSDRLIKIYPNPVSGFLYFSETCEDLSYEIRDITGKLILNDKVPEKVNIGLHNLDPGIYSISIFQQEKLLQTTKLLLLAN